MSDSTINDALGDIYVELNKFVTDVNDGLLNEALEGVESSAEWNYISSRFPYVEFNTNVDFRRAIHSRANC